jgi:hypothetical protein
MEDLFQRYGEALAQWPDVQAHDEPIDYTSPAGLRIEDRLGGLRNAEGQRGRVVLESSDLVKKGQYQRHTLIKHWVTHLAAHVAGAPHHRGGQQGGQRDPRTPRPGARRRPPGRHPAGLAGGPQPAAARGGEDRLCVDQGRPRAPMPPPRPARRGRPQGLRG